jgi:hypothetical protein
MSNPKGIGGFAKGPDPRRGPGGRAPLATAAWKRWCRNLTKRKRLEIETMALLDPGTMRTIIEQGHGRAHQSGDLEVKVGSLADLSDDELKAKLAAAMKALGG